MVHIRTKVLDDLPPALRYSAGIFDARQLLRTVFSLKPPPETPQRISVEALNDDGLAIANPKSKMMRVIGNSWRAVHAGIIGNTSTDPSGDGRWNCAHQITSVVRVGDWVYCVVSYAEGLSSAIYKWRVGFPNKRYRVRLKDSLTANWIAAYGPYVFVNAIHSHYDEGAQTNTHHSITIAIEPQADGSDRDVQWEGSEPIYFDSNAQVYHALTKVSSAPIPSPNGKWDQKECTSGFAVNSKFWAVAREGQGQVAVYNRANVQVQTWLFDRPRHITFTPDGSYVWVSYGNNTLECYVLNADGSLGELAPMPRINGLVDPVGVSISPNGQQLVTIDGNRYNQPGSTATHKVRIWSTATGELLRTIGSGDYATNVLVNDRKYMFINAKSFAKTTKGGAVPYVQWLSDDELVYADMGNSRNIFYRFSTDTIYDKLCYEGYVYSTRLVANREQWLMIGYRRFRIDWDAVVRDQSVIGHWELEANYGAFQRPEFDDEYNRALDITMFPDGKMFAFLQHQAPADGSAPDYYLLGIELNDSGITYFEGERYPIGTNLNRDLSLVRDRAYVVDENGQLVLGGNGKPQEKAVGEADNVRTNLVRERRAFTGARNPSGSPAWASPVARVVLDHVTNYEPITFGGAPGRNTYTTSGIWAYYCQNGSYNKDMVPFGDITKRHSYYLGGSPIDFSGTTSQPAGMVFRTLKPTIRGVYGGGFPVGRMEDSNESWNMAAFHYALGNHIMTVYLGEHWKDRQVHMVDVHDDHGQMEFQFGAPNRSDGPLEEAPPFLVSNGKTGDFFQVTPDVMAEVVCDEGMQAGVLCCLVVNMTSSWVRYYPLEEHTPVADPANIDLQAGLPAAGVVVNGAGRVERSATESESFSVKTGVLEPEAEFEGDLVDVNITLKPQLSPNLRQATVYFRFAEAPQGFYEIRAIVRFLLQAFDDTGDHCYVETVDKADRIINQFNRTRNSSNGAGELRHNGLVIGSRTVEEWRPLSFNQSELRTGQDETGSYVQYADFPRSYATGPLDPLADAQHPVALRVRIDTPSTANREFGVNVAGAKYASLTSTGTPTTPTTPTTPPTPIRMVSTVPAPALTADQQLILQLSPNALAHHLAGHTVLLYAQLPRGVAGAWLAIPGAGTGSGGTTPPQVNLLAFTEAQLNEVLALTYTDCDADPADSPAWSLPGQHFDAIDAQGRNCHFYCARGTFNPAAPSGTTGTGPAWHYFIKLG